MLLAAGLGAVVAATLMPAAALGRDGNTAHGYIVTFRQGASVDTTVSRLKTHVGVAPTHVFHSALDGFAARLSASQVDRLRTDTDVLTIQRDLPMHALEQTLPTGTDRIEGDMSTTRSGDGTGAVDVDVAVIDTGIDLAHPDLNVVGGRNCSGGNPKAFADENGHGTHVAGIIAAKDDGVGVVGVAPGARLWAVRVLDANGSGSWSSVICGIDFVTRNAPANGGRIKVANLSLGGRGTDGSCSDGGLRQAICRATAAGVTFVAAAGNNSTDFGSSIPATYPEVLTVTAIADFDGKPGSLAGSTCRTGTDDVVAGFSNYAMTAEDSAHTVAAPGVCILSTWKGGGYNTISGTSMASPQVAGTAALCIATGRCASSPSAVQATIRSDAAAQAPAYGFGGDPWTNAGTRKAVWYSGRYYGYLASASGN